MLEDFEARAALDLSPTVQNYLESAVELTLVTNNMTKDSRWELNMTKKYTVESSTIVRRMVGWPPGSEVPVLMLMKTITENIMASKARDSDIYVGTK